MQFVMPVCAASPLDKGFRAIAKPMLRHIIAQAFSLKAEGSNRQMSPVQIQKLKREQAEAETESEPGSCNQYALRDQYHQ
ncbi:MAG TPA: hypothetical protein PLD20_20505 [Blastocatellia bacterium]|nr:hypothetical protein [Blastocatellia bacterium]HMX29838.1 hypothetical protein [Blastocatellia bacterium]HMY74017.1 hypothetical protein [Blastocatellia bacterium]HMZ20329.1 hypothetical protein [Blastocatellia bacterium]HNG33745.1 hypothetical protein [Blastocatellia bacterium]